VVTIVTYDTAWSSRMNAKNTVTGIHFTNWLTTKVVSISTESVLIHVFLNCFAPKAEWGDKLLWSYGNLDLVTDEELLSAEMDASSQLGGRLGRYKYNGTFKQISQWCSCFAK